MKVLVAEDDPIFNKYLEKVLSHWNYEPVCVSNGNDALAVLKGPDSPDLAILDWSMPGISGLDVCRTLRSEMDIHRHYIIILTGRTEKEDLVEGLEAGADDYVIKPFNPMEMRSRLKVAKRLIDYKVKLEQKQIQLQAYVEDMQKLADERAKMLVHADRLATLGVLSAGMAHEINNPATFISGNLQTFEKLWPSMEAVLLAAQESGSPDTKIRIALEAVPDMIKDMRKGVNRITTIIKSLKTYSRQERGRRTPCNVHLCIEEALHLCNNVLKYNIQIEKKFMEKPPFIAADKQQIQQVFINLIMNAVDAMGQRTKGLLRFTTRREGQSLIVQVDDNGPGIPRDKLADIWKPFFTTKSVGDGTGLGLSITQGIVIDHGGEIIADNTPVGARFTIVLPVKTPPGTVDEA